MFSVALLCDYRRDGWRSQCSNTGNAMTTYLLQQERGWAYCTIGQHLSGSCVRASCAVIRSRFFFWEVAASRKEKSPYGHVYAAAHLYPRPRTLSLEPRAPGRPLRAADPARMGAERHFVQPLAVAAKAAAHLLVYPANAHCRRFQAAIGHWEPWIDGAFSSQTSLADFRCFVRKEIAAIWYLLDTPFLPCTGMSRAMLLVEHGKYLREMLHALTRKPGALPAYLEVEHTLLELMGRRPTSRLFSRVPG